jgi:hypothetical protein
MQSGALNTDTSLDKPNGVVLVVLFHTKYAKTQHATFTTAILNLAQSSTQLFHV